jgi:hypothetical protein
MHDEISRITFRAFPQSRGVLRWLGTHFLENTVAHIFEIPPPPNHTPPSTPRVLYLLAVALGVGAIG